MTENNRRSESQAEQAYLQLRKEILTCLLAPGSVIAQAQLVKRYDFGITPVREALKRLEQEGFVQSLPRFGYLITPVTLQDVHDLYDLRLVLESAAVKMAIERAGPEELAELQRQAGFRYTFGDRESYLVFLDKNVRFHMTIAMLSGNRKLAEMVGGVLNQMTRIFNLGLDLRDSADEMMQEHTALIAAITQRDVDQAVALVDQQIRTSRQRVVEMLGQYLNREALAKLV